MKKYEIMAIIVNSLDEKSAKKAADESLKKRITNFGGEITFEDFWGAKGFAYKIEGEKWGYYAVYQFDIDGSKLKEFEHELNIDKDIVRFLITKVEKEMPKPVKHSDVKTSEPTKVEEKEETRTEKPAKKEVKVKETKKIEPKAEKKINKDDVDKKLDAILDDASLGL